MNFCISKEENRETALDQLTAQILLTAATIRNKATQPLLRPHDDNDNDADVDNNDNDSDVDNNNSDADDYHESS